MFVKMHCFTVLFVAIVAILVTIVYNFDFVDNYLLQYDEHIDTISNVFETIKCTIFIPIEYIEHTILNEQQHFCFHSRIVCGILRIYTWRYHVLLFLYFISWGIVLVCIGVGIIVFIEIEIMAIVN